MTVESFVCLEDNPRHQTAQTDSVETAAVLVGQRNVGSGWWVVFFMVVTDTIREELAKHCQPGNMPVNEHITDMATTRIRSSEFADAYVTL